MFFIKTSLLVFVVWKRWRWKWRIPKMRYIGTCSSFVLIRSRLKFHYKRLIIDCLKCYIRTSSISNKGHLESRRRYRGNPDGIRYLNKWLLLYSRDYIEVATGWELELLVTRLVEGWRVGVGWVFGNAGEDQPMGLWIEMIGVGWVHINWIDIAEC